MGAWGVLLFESNPGHPPESSRGLGDRGTLPLAALAPQPHMLMERKVSRASG